MIGSLITTRRLAACALFAMLALGACQSYLEQPAMQEGKPLVSEEKPPVPEKEIPRYPFSGTPEEDSNPILPPGVTSQPIEQVASLPPTRKPSPQGSVRIGILLPLSGPMEALGQAMLNAAQMAMFAMADQKFELAPLDTRGTPEGAKDAAHAAIVDGVSAILGPLLAPSVRSVTPLARAREIPIIAFSSDHTVAGNGVYTMGFLPEAEVERIVAFALSKGIKTFAALAPANTYGVTVTTAFGRAIEAGGGVLERVRLYNPESDDFSHAVKSVGDFAKRQENLQKELEKLEDKKDDASIQAREHLEQLQTLGDPPYEALLLAGGGKRLQSIAALLPFYDVDPDSVRILGTGQWDEPGLGAEPALLGGWYAAPPPSARLDFSRKYEAAFGEMPPRLATLAYDAVALAAFLARTGSGRGFDAEFILDPVGFSGRDGIFRFTPKGTVERGLAVLQVGRKESRVIAPAPKAFQRARP